MRGSGHFACPHRKGRILVLDASKREQFETQPEKLTIERDFNRVDALGVEPDVLEAKYGEIESEIAVAVRDTVAAQKFNSEDDENLIANFVALLMVRNPRAC